MNYRQDLSDLIKKNDGLILTKELKKKISLENIYRFF